MNFQSFKVLMLATSVLASAESFSQVKRLSCEVPLVQFEGREKTIEDFKSKKVLLLNESEITDAELQEFLSSFKLFPEDLYNSITDAGGSVLLISGQGVTRDPKWKAEVTVTVEGTRRWDDVAGSGGSPAFGIPTRIVVNKYHNHGSVNLFLHEHGHALDAIYGDQTISESSEWKQLLSDTPNLTDYLNVLSPDGYNSIYPRETFAELFAQYHACDATREQMEREIPQVAAYFQQLDSDNLKNLKKIAEDKEELRKSNWLKKWKEDKAAKKNAETAEEKEAKRLKREAQRDSFNSALDSFGEKAESTFRKLFGKKKKSNFEE